MNMVNSIGLEFGLYHSPNPGALGSSSPRPFLDIKGNDYYNPLLEYFCMLDYHYLSAYIYGSKGHNIDNWISFIDQQIFLNNNQEYFGDAVCVLFKDQNVRLILYVDYEQGLDRYCDLEVMTLRKLTVEWKAFVIRWGVKFLKHEL